MLMFKQRLLLVATSIYLQKSIFVCEGGEVSQAADQLVILASCHSGSRSGTEAASQFKPTNDCTSRD